MNIAVTHRSHVHVPWVPIVATLAAILVAAAVLVLINRPGQTSTGTAVSAAPATAAAEIAKPETPAMRRVLAETLVPASSPAAAGRYVHNHMPGMTLDQIGSAGSGAMLTAAALGRSSSIWRGRDPYWHNRVP
jgi:hypothetical protein